MNTPDKRKKKRKREREREEQDAACKCVCLYIYNSKGPPEIQNSGPPAASAQGGLRYPAAGFVDFVWSL